MPDSDQSSHHQQRLRQLISPLLVLLALAIGGCAGHSVKTAVDGSTSSETATETPADLTLPSAPASTPNTLGPGDGLIWARLRRGFQLRDV
ncbi:MAG: YgdI/YgdR family lipoprotein, partial [Gammaproteobacteria bacterium]|nr:YgdI/YgdR family lipoprotein [Gammaproteobacteria bacterium]